MSAVWVATHQALRAQVAVKFLSPDLLEDPVSVARFEREASAAAQVKSPHVVQYLDHGICEHGPYLVMELLEGEDLTQRLKRSPMSLDEINQLVTQLGRALQKAHESGVVHRDIKPDNIFLLDVGGDFFCKLIDFGVAKSVSETTTAISNRTATGSMLGTPYYMSPEQAINAKDIDHRADLWSLGMVAFEAMTGRKALDVDGLGALVLALHTGTLPRPSEFNRALTPAIDTWFSRACAREVEDRFQSAREMTDAFTAAIEEPAVPSLSTPTVPARVPSLRPLPPVAPAPSPTPPLPQALPQEGWDQLIERTGAREDRPSGFSLEPTVPATPYARRALAVSEPARAPFDLSRLPLGLVAVAVALLLFTGISLLVRGRDALTVLFPAYYPPASASAP